MPPLRVVEISTSLFRPWSRLNRIGSPLQVPFNRSAQARFPRAGTIPLGSALKAGVTFPGLNFAYYTVRDDAGRGGSVMLGAADGVSWGIARVR